MKTSITRCLATRVTIDILQYKITIVDYVVEIEKYREQKLTSVNIWVIYMLPLLNIDINNILLPLSKYRYFREPGTSDVYLKISRKYL